MSTKIRKNNSIFRQVLLLTLILLLASPTGVLAATLVIDGSFSDWVGMPNLTDPAGDVTPARVDLTAFYWGTNPGVSTVYFMIQRNYPGGQGNASVYYRIFIDTNCNGSSSEAVDRILFIYYDPSGSSGSTSLTIYTGTGGQISSSSGNWGDPAGSAPTGGTRTEVSASFSDLGITVNQQICVNLGSYQNANEGLPADAIGPLVWAPVPAMGIPLLVTFIIGASVLAWLRFRRRDKKRA